MHVPIELKQKYLARRIQDIHKLRELLNQDDFSWALKVGHQVKGNASTFEFSQISDLGKNIEEAAKRQDKLTLSCLVDDLERMIHAQIQLLSDSLLDSQFG